MNPTELSIGLELTFAGDRPSGRAQGACGPGRTFSGWLGLLAAIDALRADAEAHDERTTMTTTLNSSPTAILRPGDPRYDAARAGWNLTAEQTPAAVCVARSVADVRAALDHARQHGLHVAPQTTGHLGQALPPLDRTLLLKTALHDGEVEVDPIARVARVKAGAVWGDVVAAVAPHGLAAMHGSSPTVGVIGYLLGGGLSFYGRQHGLAVNHVRAFEVVTPDRRLRRVSVDEEPDLFFALRGGGGSFAVVCSVELGLLPYAEVTGGALFFRPDAAFRLLRAWRDWARDAPRSVTTTFRLLCLPRLPEIPEPLRGVPTVCVDGVSLDRAEGTRLEQRLCGVAPPILGGFGPMPSAAVARLHGDPEDPVPAMGDGMLLAELDDWAIEAFLRVAGPGSPPIAAELRHLGGALGTSPAHAGARGHLEGNFLLFGCGIPGAPMPAAGLEAHLDALLGALAPWATGTRFASFAERHGSLEGCVPPASLDRLRRTRAVVDPDRILVPAHPLEASSC